MTRPPVRSPNKACPDRQGEGRATAAAWGGRPSQRGNPQAARRFRRAGAAATACDDEKKRQNVTEVEARPTEAPHSAYAETARPSCPPGAMPPLNVSAQA